MVNMTRGQQIAFACDRIDKATADGLAKHIDEVIQEAVESERERCAKLAAGFDLHSYGTCERIAAAIRAGNPANL